MSGMVTKPPYQGSGNGRQLLEPAAWFDRQSHPIRIVRWALEIVLFPPPHHERRADDNMAFLHYGPVLSVRRGHFWLSVASSDASSPGYIEVAGSSRSSRIYFHP